MDLASLFIYLQGSYSDVDDKWFLNEKPNFFRIYFIVSGNGNFVSQNEQIKLIKNSIYILPVNLNYKNFIKNKNTKLKLLWCHFQFKNFKSIITNTQEVFHYKVNPKSSVWYQVHSIIEDYKNNNIIDIDIGWYRIIKQLGFLNNHILFKNKYIKKAIEYISNNLNKKISLGYLSEYVNLNPIYFNRLFKKEVGVSPIHFTLSEKIKLACKYFKDEYSTKEICNILSFYDENYFSKVFKKYSGLSITEYQKVIHNKP